MKFSCNIFSIKSLLAVKMECIHKKAVGYIEPRLKNRKALKQLVLNRFIRRL